MQLVIIAGGKGTRLKEITDHLPKPMVQVGGKPLLEHQILLARKYGIRDVLILTGFGAKHIEKYFGDGSAWGVQIHYRREAQPMGTAGALLDAFDKLEDIFVVMYGDTLLNVDLSRMLAAHTGRASATLFLHPNDHPQDSDLVELDASNRAIALHPYPHPPHSCFRNLVNAALYVFSKHSLRPSRERWSQERKPIDISKHLFPGMLSEGATLQGYRSREYIKDAGTPERLFKIRRHYEAGRIQTASFETPARAVFLDRDGTLNYDHGWISSPEQIELLPGVAKAVRTINNSGYLAVVITNQPVVARGGCSEAELQRIHNRLEWLLGAEHAYVDAIYYCPHHPDGGFTGERSELKIACSCRKPATGLFESAVRELNVDVTRSWMVGDSRCDMEAALSLGISAMLIPCNQKSPRDISCSATPLRARTFLEAVDHVLRETPVPA